MIEIAHVEFIKDEQRKKEQAEREARQQHQQNDPFGGTLDKWDRPPAELLKEAKYSGYSQGGNYNQGSNQQHQYTGGNYGDQNNN